MDATGWATTRDWKSMVKFLEDRGDETGVRRIAAAGVGWLWSARRAGRSRQEAAVGLDRVKADLVRGLVDNPFLPAPAKWVTTDVAAVARAIRDGGFFADMVVLADALEDAGCEDAELLGRLRRLAGDGEDGWLLDLILGQ
jgi:hypothetical protein